MTVRIANTEMAGPRGLPQECVVCRNQDPNVLHIDFDAEADRGWYGDDPSTEVMLENIIICMNCVQEAMQAAGLRDSLEMRQEITDLKHKLDTARKSREKAERYADNLESAFDNRPQKIQLDGRKKPRERQEVA